MTELEDAQDVERTLAGDLDAYANIVDRWQGRLVTLAFRFCGDRAWAEDLAQTALVRAFRRLDQWQNKGSFSGWLITLATNVNRSALRAQRPRFETLHEADLAHGPLEPDAAQRDAARTVREAVARLPPRYRDVFVLFYFHECDIAATASTLGLPAGTVKARLARGRRILREELATRLGLEAP